MIKQLSASCAPRKPLPLSPCACPLTPRLEPAHLRVPCGLPVKLKYPTPAENDDNKSEKENAESIMLVLSMHPRVVEKAKDARAPLPTINPKHALTRTDSSAEMAVAMVLLPHLMPPYPLLPTPRH